MLEPRPWTDAELTVARAGASIPKPGEGAWLNAGTVTAYWRQVAAAVLDALTAAGWRPPPPAPDGIHWRTGTSLGRTIYNPHGHLAGLLDTPEQARAVVAALNAAAPEGDDRA